MIFKWLTVRFSRPTLTVIMSMTFRQRLRLLFKFKKMQHLVKKIIFHVNKQSVQLISERNFRYLCFNSIITTLSSATKKLILQSYFVTFDCHATLICSKSTSTFASICQTDSPNFTHHKVPQVIIKTMYVVRCDIVFTIHDNWLCDIFIS